MVIVDTSCLVTLERSGDFDILGKVFGEISITPEIENEFGKTLPAWVKVTKVKNLEYQDFLLTLLDKGEASAIALMQEMKDAILVIDELKGRKVAAKLNLNYTGTLGILLEAKKLGHIQSVKTAIAKLKLNDIRISEAEEQEILKRAEED